jgi:hypothetical protein
VDTRAWGVVAGFASALAFTPPTFAADPPDDSVTTLPCRPTIACTADLVQPGAFEIESGVLFRRLGTGSGSVRQWTYPFLLKLTLDRWIQLQAGSNGYTTAKETKGTEAVPQQYFDDALLGAKVHLVDQTALVPSLSLSATASIPTFRGQAGYVRTYDALFTAYVTKDVARIHADFNAGVNVWRIGDRAANAGPLPQGFAALAISMNLPRPFGIMAEAYCFSDAAPIAPRDGGFLFALSHSPKPWLIFDFGGDVGWFPSSRAYSVFIGMTIVPVVLWGRATETRAHGPIEERNGT